MPRTGKGGMRQGAVGQSYGNRTDLNTSMPIETAPNQPYGVAAEQRAAQQAIPVAAQPLQGVTPQAQAPAQPATVSEQMPQPQQHFPGELPFLHPTENPDEPVTAGAMLGPGPGPEALSGPVAPVTNELSAAAARYGSPVLMDLANAAAVLKL